MSKTVLMQIFQGFKERSESLNLKGKKRENALIDYMSGSIRALKSVGMEDESNYIGRYLIMVTLVQGYKDVERTLKEMEPIA